MIPIPSGSRVWIATRHADMRRSMQGWPYRFRRVSSVIPKVGGPFYIPRSPWRSGQDSVHDGIGCRY
jgi:hypothetical protein